MKRIFKVLGYALAVVAIGIGGAAAYFYFKGMPTAEPGVPAQYVGLKVPADSALVARGANIASIMCRECHGNPETGRYTGKPLAELPAMFGKLASYNITHDPVHGVGGWTDGELAYFLRTGVRKDGSWAAIMPKFTRVSDQDLYAIIAWLRSDDPMLAADPREYPPNEYNLLLKVLGNTVFGIPQYPEQPVPMPPADDRVAHGRYLANDLFGCYHCHSGDLMKVAEVPEESFDFYGGGAVMKTPEGKDIRTANLTPDPETGIGRLTEQQFIDAVKYGKNPRGGALSAPMTPHTTLTDAEISAIFAYLKTVPAIHKPIERFKAAGVNH